MPLYFVAPASNTDQTVHDLLARVSRLDGILAAQRPDCMDMADILYLEIATRDAPIPTILLDEFRGTNGVSKVFESVELFESRIKSAIHIAMQLGDHVAVVAPSSVIQQWTGITLNPGEVYEYSDEESYYERCSHELEEWSTSS